MGDNDIYIVIDDSGNEAMRTKSLSNAVLFVEGYFEKYWAEPIQLSIKRKIVEMEKDEC